MQNTETGTVSGGVVQIPSDCRQVQSLRLSLGGRDAELSPLPPSRLKDAALSMPPIGYVTVGEALQIIGDGNGSTYTLTYWQELPDLASAPMNRNWLILREPGLYLYGALLEASPYIQDLTMVQAWQAQYQDIMAKMQAEDDRARYGNSPSMQVRVP